MTTTTDLPGAPAPTAGPEADGRTSLDTGSARNLATTTKSAPQMQATSPRWLLRRLPWLALDAGTFRVNRRLTATLGDGRVSFVQTGSQVQVIPAELAELAELRGFTEAGVLTALAARFEQRAVEPGTVLAEAGAPVSEVILLAHGKIRQLVPGAYAEAAVIGTLADGDQAGATLLADLGAGELGPDESGSTESGSTESGSTWPHTLRAVTPCILLTLSRQALAEFLDSAPALRAHLRRPAAPRGATNKYGEAEVALASGHHGEPVLPGTFVDYEPAPREYELSVAQAVLRVHTRVADLFSTPMDQTQQQVRLTVEALKERQEHDLLNHPDFGLLHNAAFSQRVQTRTGPPTPEDFDELLSRRRSTEFFLAHPQAIAAFRRQCTARGLYPGEARVDGVAHTAWRGVPVLPSDKIPVTAQGTSTVLALRIGAADSGVVGLRPTALPDEVEPGLNVRFTGIDERAVSSYLVSAYFSAAVLVPDALGLLENVELGR